MNTGKVVPFPRTPRWSVARLAELSREIDAFDAKARSIPGAHPEHDDGPSDRFMSLALAIHPDLSAWFWPEDLRHEFFELLRRLKVTT
jgi:hypothetical protein